MGKPVPLRMIFNMNNELVSNPAVSKAIAMCVDRQDIALVTNLGWYASFIMPKHVYDVEGVEWVDNPAAQLANPETPPPSLPTPTRSSRAVPSALRPTSRAR